MPRLSDIHGVTLDAVDEGYVVIGGAADQTFPPTELHRACAVLFEIAAKRARDEATKTRLLATAMSWGHVPALNRRDWEAVRATLDEGFVWTDHRAASYGRNEGADLYVSIARGNAEEVPSGRWTLTDLLAMSERGVLVEVLIDGDVNGGAIEVAALVLVVYGQRGLAITFDTYGLEQRETALAAFTERCS